MHRYETTRGAGRSASILETAQVRAFVARFTGTRCAEVQTQRSARSRFVAHVDRRVR